MINDEMIKEKANFYFNNQQKVHITLIKSLFYNGIIQRLGGSNLVVLDEKLGDVFLSYNEIYNIEPFIKDEKKEDNVL